MSKKKLTIFGAFKSLDIFGRKIEFNVKGKMKTRTYFGAVLSIMALAILLIYAYSKVDILFGYRDTIHKSYMTYQDDIQETFAQERSNINLSFSVT